MTTMVKMMESNPKMKGEMDKNAPIFTDSRIGGFSDSSESGVQMERKDQKTCRLARLAPFVCLIY